MKEQDKKVEKKDNKKQKETPSKNKKKVLEDDTYDNQDQKAKELAAAALKNQQQLQEIKQTPHFGAISNVPPNLTPSAQQRMANYLVNLKNQLWNKK